MLKKTLLTLLSFALVGMISAQSLQFEHNGTVYQDGQTIVAPFVDFEYYAEMHIRNLTDQELNVIIEQNIIDSVQDSYVYFCWGLCYNPHANPFISDPVAIPANTLSDQDLSFHVILPEGVTGAVKAIYYAYPENDPNNKISLIVLSGDVTNVNENAISLSSAYPNPASSQVHFDCKGNSNAVVNAVVYNLLGQEVKSQLVNGSQSRINIAVDDMQPGIYFCRFSINGEIVKTEKFIVKR